MLKRSLQHPSNTSVRGLPTHPCVQGVWLGLLGSEQWGLVVKSRGFEVIVVDSSNS